MSDQLRLLPRKLIASERAAFIEHGDVDDIATPLVRAVALSDLDSLMMVARELQLDDEWDDRSVSDRWLAPRIHHALRLFRSEASDRGLWQWLALRYSWYLQWRWQDREGLVTDDRWWGPIHKQALARLWWGAEIFRDGPDYRPVERAFVYQDLPNSYLHRPVVRCRSLALAIVDRFDGSNSAAAKEVNGLARVLNLATVGSPPEVETLYQNDDLAAYEKWVTDHSDRSLNWSRLPLGPSAADTTDGSKAGGHAIVERGWGYYVSMKGNG